jgi:hypothetical protein
MTSGWPGAADQRESRSRQFGDGILSRYTNQVYWVVATEFYFVVATLPLIFALMFLDRDRSNAILYAIGGMFLGPALAATLHCMRKIMREHDLDPTRDFVHGYRLNVADTLRASGTCRRGVDHSPAEPASLDSRARHSTPYSDRTPGVILLGALLLMNMLVISTAFSFRCGSGAAGGVLPAIAPHHLGNGDPVHRRGAAGLHIRLGAAPVRFGLRICSRSIPQISSFR